MTDQIDDVSASSIPTLSNHRLILEVHAHVSDAPTFKVGKFGVIVFKVVALYRRVTASDPWEFIEIVVHGIWADGVKQGDVAHRRYTRGKLTLLQHWMLEFIKNNHPGK